MVTAAAPLADPGAPRYTECETTDCETNNRPAVTPCHPEFNRGKPQP